MIVREILTNPHAILKDFDWFNDYKDTRTFLQGRKPEDHEAAMILILLEAGYAAWLWAVKETPKWPFTVLQLQQLRAVTGSDQEALRYLKAAVETGNAPLTLWELARPFRENPYKATLPPGQLPPLGEASHFNRIGQSVATLIAHGHSVEIVPCIKSMKSDPHTYSIACPSLAFHSIVPLMDIAELLEEAVRLIPARQTS